MRINTDWRKWGVVEWGIIASVMLLFFSVILFAVAQPVFSTTADTVTIVVKPGMASDDIAHMLYQKHVIANEKLFQLTAKMQGVENALQAGEYVLTKDMSIPRMLAMMTKGQTTYRQITIPEGYTVDQIAKLLSEKNLGNAAKFKAAAEKLVPYDFMTPNPNTLYAVEGFAFPDTYRFSANLSEEQFLKMMIDNFNAKLTADMKSKAAAKGLTIRDLITLASLVEKEARADKDRPIIAGVFLNRLKQNMPLQSCATIQYILGYPKPELTVQDTEIPSPYNTYRNMGLPPGPIANPGIAAIKAVLEAEPTDYLYFVADRQGLHHFSRTYEEHLAMIEKVRS